MYYKIEKGENMFLDLEKIVDLTEVFKLQEQVSLATEVAMLTVDFKGKPLTEHSGCSEFCKMMRNTSDYKNYCERCDSYGGLEAVRKGEPYVYICHMGLVDFAVPIFSNGQYLGSIMCGQIQLDAPYSQLGLEKICNNPNSDQLIEKYKELYKKIPLMSLERVKAITKVLAWVCTKIVEFSILQGSDPLNIEVAPTEARPSYKKNKNKLIISPALDYISDTYNKKVSLNYVANLCDISSSHFSKLFKKTMEVNLVDYVNILRINKAKELLATTSKNINEIAYAVGFEDCGYFIKVFKKITTATPNKYRA